MRRPARVPRVAVVGAAIAIVLLLPAVAPGSVRVVARGFDNPRGLDFGPGGSIYVAEAGRGGGGPCVPGPDGSTMCFGPSGAVTRVDLRRGRATRIVKGLPSLAAPDGSQGIGPSDVFFDARGRGYLTVGLGANPALRGQLPAPGAAAAQLFNLRRDGRLRGLADLGAFEGAANPDAAQPGAAVDTNPNSVNASGRRRVVVVDAGGNDVLTVNRRGHISVLGVLPFGMALAPNIPGVPVPPGTPIPVQSVPTSVVRGPDGAYYVGQLTGFPFPRGAAKVWSIVPGSPPRVFASGFTQITDLAFGRDGSLYVLEIASAPMIGPPSPGALIRVRRNGTRQELARGRLREPTGLVVDRRNAYVSNHGASAGLGELVRITLPRR
jgi:hypothetical protein